jgi:CubicO group peptidase (beta-lactamase class C family)
MRQLVLALAFLGAAVTSGPKISAAGVDGLALDALTGGAEPTALLDNSRFVPAAEAAPAHEPFEGTVQLAEIEMRTEPASFKSRDVLGKDPKIFPAVSLSSFTEGDDLVPVTQDVIRYGSTPTGRSFWDIIVQPGKVWSDTGDDGWSRASFPFSLVHSIEGETHNGVALFAYRGSQMTDLRFQITQQTSPYYVEDYFVAYGSVPAEWTRETPPNLEALRKTHMEAVASAVELRPWSELQAKVGEDKLSGFDSDLKPSELVADGLAVDGEFFLKSCPSAAGDLAYCERQRFGVWSVTKAAATAVALLRLAEKYGPAVFDEKLVTFLSEAKGKEGWEAMTFGDLLNMASGLGNGSPKREPNDISDGYLDGTYPAWYEARTEAGKIEAVLRDSNVYPWGPGQVARYRDEDMFLLGVAMKRFLQAKEGEGADLWDMLENEVYEPIGILHAPTNRTIEEDGSRGQPLMAYGFYPTISDLVKIARLVQNGGKHEGRQILHAGKLADIMPGPSPRGLPTGDADMPHYRKAFWQAEFASRSGCSITYPVMSGWGANVVPIFSADVLAIRLAKNWDGADAAGKLGSLAAVADRVAPVCKQ